jgi:hypothetical protein
MGNISPICPSVVAERAEAPIEPHPDTGPSREDIETRDDPNAAILASAELGPNTRSWPALPGRGFGLRQVDTLTLGGRPIGPGATAPVQHDDGTRTGGAWRNQERARRYARSRRRANAECRVCRRACMEIHRHRLGLSAAAFLASVSLGLLAACGSGTGSTVEILNDTNHSVLLKQCKHEDCRGGFAGKGVSKPGRHFWTGVSTVGVPNPWLVLAPATGHRLGCLPIVFTEPREGVVARVSELVTCRSSYDEHTDWPPGI